MIKNNNSCNADIVEKFDFLRTKMLNIFSANLMTICYLEIHQLLQLDNQKLLQIILKEAENRDWQYLVQPVIKFIENDKNHLKPLQKKKKKKKNNIKIKIKSIKHNYKVPQRVYSSIYANIVEQFKIYVNSLMPDKIDEIEDNF